MLGVEILSRRNHVQIIESSTTGPLPGSGASVNSGGVRKEVVGNGVGHFRGSLHLCCAVVKSFLSSLLFF